MNNWDNSPQRNLLLPDNLERVRGELANGGVIFGWHYYYAGGGSGSMFTFLDYESYYQELIQSHPGDHFTVFSVDRIAERAMLRVGSADSNQPIVIDQRLAGVKNALAASKEIAFVWRHRVPGTGRTECDAGILDQTDEELEQCLDLRSGRSGEWVFFLMDMLDEDEEGVPIKGVSPGGRKRVHALVDGKRPNDAGLTPSSGPY
ncbi:MAG: hypothetical protein LAP38_10920 [Acidobacteriia bacterium]|nr:hypothetical protein [Terriglobia bacterium]